GERGREATRPSEIPREGWRDILIRVKNSLGEDNVGIVAAGIAFFSFLAIFPALIATIMTYGLLVSPQEVTRQLQALTGVMPQQARDLLEQLLGTIAAQAPQSLGWGVAISILFALWSANKGMKALFQGVNIAYNEKEGRGIIRQQAITLLFTLGAIIVVIISGIMVVALPIALAKFGIPAPVQTLLSWGRWLLLAFMILISVSLVYRFAPARRNPRWRWVSWGAIFAVLLWIAGSWAFSYYVANFGNYNEMYGSLASVVILMLWFMLSSFVILLGAEINAEMEGQTRKDSTTGPEKPMGERGAHQADNLSETP
ncbi:MAG: YihY/virulence factor BrkB family protein, partial [Desulfurivibrionaceae bacterium]